MNENLQNYSVLMSVYYKEKPEWLKESIESILNQTIPTNDFVIIKDGKLIEKRELKLPKKIVNVLHCKNPRCITSIEQELEHVFVLTDKENGTYSCQYCEEKQGKLWEKL